MKVDTPAAPTSTDLPEEPPKVDDLPFNPSEYGLVHLPPLPSSNPTSERGSSTRSGPSSQKSRGHSHHSQSSNQSMEDQSSTQANKDSNNSSNHQSRTVSSESQTSSQSGTNSAMSEDLITFRFKHARDEYGNHVVIGREGKLQRCEDEPIRTPGAVQGFGVLIAVDEQEDALVLNISFFICYSSQNSTELLGLSPRYLFSLECFTDTLPESQAGVLWDNIQFLTEPDINNEEEESSPHVFMLSGWGDPGSAQLEDLRESTDGRRMWTCWCAVHRAPTIGNTSTPSSGGLIVMEFELERDTLNPLYPPIQPEAPAISPSSSSGHTTVDGMTVSPGSTSSATSTVGIHSTSTSTPPLTIATDVSAPNMPRSLSGLKGEDEWLPSTEDIIESTTSRAKPLAALERLRRMTRPESSEPSTPTDSSSARRRSRRSKNAGGSGVGMMDVFAVMAQINEQLGAAPDLDTFLKIVAGVIKDLTQFHRVLVYQFDEVWNGVVVAELVDWSQTHDLYRGLHFPAADIPAQARELYAINKVRLLYDRGQSTARIVVRNKDDLETPLNMTHCYLRAMSPIHVRYLENMGVRASMSVSILAFGQLWGLIACHSYGDHGMRVSFPVRQMLRLLSQSISRNIERLSYAQRLYTRKLINTLASDQHPTGYIVSNADDLLGLFDADFGILVIGEGAKILGPNQHGQEILIMAEYLRLKQFDTIQASQAVINDFPDLQLTTGFEVIAGLLYVPLSSGGKDFIAFLRRGQPREVHWAGKPYKEGQSASAMLEPRKSFKIWSETVAGRCRMWTDEQLETAGVLALVYGKFIEVWRQKESALQTTKLTNILLSNASHEVRTPLNHIINYLEMALNGPLDLETRDNLSRSHAASKSLLFTINDLLDLTRLESGNETSFNEPFDLHFAIEDATLLYRKEAERRDIKFNLELNDSPITVVGDAKKIRTVVQNLTANALKYTERGSISVSCRTFGEPEGLRGPKQTAVDIVVADTGCGIPKDKLESIFREFEQVESSEPKSNADSGVGLGLAVVARIVEQLGGRLRVDSKISEGSCFSFLIPLALPVEGGSEQHASPRNSSGTSSLRSRSRSNSITSGKNEIENLVEALAADHMTMPLKSPRLEESNPLEISLTRPSMGRRTSSSGATEITGPSIPIRSVKLDEFDLDLPGRLPRSGPSSTRSLTLRPFASPVVSTPIHESSTDPSKLRVLIVEWAIDLYLSLMQDNDINRTILAKRLTMSGHTVVNTTNGQEGLTKVETDRAFDAVLMDIQMPILNGFEATQRIRELEKADVNLPPPPSRRLSHILNGRIPIFAVSASLLEQQREELSDYGMDGWILKPIDFKRLNFILKGVTDPTQRQRDVYKPGCSWESGGWLKERQATNEH
ncbi:hypothetical protein BDQ12DRAFT_697388 [Crucibulum laeve]|uniref:GAF domain-like protein n=1 Tax=Crucibulum laeve TaxID=68775 RepID=A0A5C3M5L1_9AGAR|nr:hypothetical protein BDQ12DRAFT_697388 [Crucibulum laeve]